MSMPTDPISSVVKRHKSGGRNFTGVKFLCVGEDFNIKNLKKWDIPYHFDHGFDTWGCRQDTGTNGN